MVIDTIITEKQKYQNDSGIGKEVYFFKRGDGKIFAAQKIEAWELIRGQGNWARKDIVYIGKSDGKLYKKVIAEAKIKKQKLMAEKRQLQKELQRYIEIEDKLRFEDMIKEDLISSDDKTIMEKVDKLRRVMKFIKDVEKKLEIVNDKIKNFNKVIINKAIKAEIKNIKKVPHGISNEDIITPVKADRIKIIKNLMETNNI